MVLATAAGAHGPLGPPSSQRQPPSCAQRVLQAVEAQKVSETGITEEQGVESLAEPSRDTAVQDDVCYLDISCADSTLEGQGQVDGPGCTCHD